MLAGQYGPDPGVVGQTLEAALRRWLPGVSWTEVRKLVRSRRVLVNGTLTLDQVRRLGESDIVRILTQSTSPPPTDDDVRVVHLDQDLVVVEKPAGMLTLRHRAERGWSEARKRVQPSLDEVIGRILGSDAAARLSAARRNESTVVRCVQRLDRETSGLLVFARTPGAEQKLIEQFSAHTVNRVYHAVVMGYLAEQRIETRLVRDRGDGLRGSTRDRAAGQRAVTHVRPLEQFGDLTLLECRLETGRTHQIRIHLSELGHPVCGDLKYGQTADATGAPRLALHAGTLGFIHPGTGQPLDFSMAYPKDLARFIERLRRSAS